MSSLVYKEMLFSCLCLFSTTVLCQYDTTTQYYGTDTISPSSYAYSSTASSQYYVSTTTPSTTYYQSFSSSYLYSPSSSSATLYTTTPISTPSLTGAAKNSTDPTASTQAWYQTTAGKWGLGASGTSGCMCIAALGVWCVKKRHRRAAKGMYSKLSRKHGKKGHDVANCGQCSAGYVGGGQAQQPFLYDPHRYTPNVGWQQPQALSGAWHGNA